MSSLRALMRGPCTALLQVQADSPTRRKVLENDGTIAIVNRGAETTPDRFGLRRLRGSVRRGT